MTVAGTPPPTKHMLANAMSDIIRTVDEHAKQINKRWGFNLLPHLVPIEWTERFKTQRHKWQLACFECAGSLVPEELDRVRKHGEAMIRAYERLEKEAVAIGHMPTAPVHWEFELQDGTPVILVRDRADLDRVDAKGRQCQIWLLDEIADIVAKFPDIARVKDAFPGAEVIQLGTSAEARKPLNMVLEDAPF